MNPGKSQFAVDANKEISALIETLHRTEQRLEELTAGEVDTVADRDGRTLLLRRAQYHLRHHEAAKRAAILNALPVHIALLDNQGFIISVNEAWRRFGRASASQGPGYEVGVNYLGSCDGAHGDDAAVAQQAAKGIRSVLEGAEESFSLEYPCHSGTEQHWFLMTVTPLGEDHTNGAVVMHMNITERKQATDALRTSLEEFRTLAEAMPQIVWITRPDGWSIYISKQWMEYTGLSIEESLGRGWNKPFHPDDRQQAWHAWQRAMATTTNYSTESRLRRADGAYRWWLVRGVPLQDASGKILKWFGTCTDIHDLKVAQLKISQTNLELRESERRFSDLLGNVELISVMLDREARITYCNEYLLRLTGWQSEEVVGRNWFELFIPPEINVLTEAFFASLVDNPSEARHHENEVLTRSGERRLVRWNNTVLRSGAGDVIGSASIGEDITERKRAQQALEQLRRWSDLILESIGEGIHGIDTDGNIYFENPAAAQLLGYKFGELFGKPAHPAIHHARKDGTPYPIADCPIHTTIRDGVVRRVGDEVFWRKDGSSVSVEYTVAPIRNDRGELAGAVVAFRDIAERKAAENRVAYLSRIHAVLSGINSLIVRVNDRDELFREACQVAVETGGFRMSLIAIVDRSAMQIVPIASAGKDKVILTGIKDLLSSSEDAPKTMIAQAIREKEAIVSNDTLSDPRVLLGKQYAESGVRSMAILPLIVADQAVGAIALYAREIEFFRDEELTLLSQLAGDIAFAINHIDKQERLDYLAYYDSITGLANRRLFLDRLKQYKRSALSGGHKLALFLIDLERFKNINDSLGRPAGDALLKQVAEWLTHSAGDANLLARMGEDHFAMVVPEVTQEGDVARLLEKMMEDFLEHPFSLNDAVFRIAAKVGIALFPDDGTDAETLFRNAEAALKKAKANGERYLFYTQKMTATVAGMLTLENQLRQALDKEEFVLYYQPKVNLVSGKLTGVEALIRWNDPRTGLVPPDRFIPILEETGLIHGVGRWALRQTIEDYRRWRVTGLTAVRIAVNVSPLQLRSRSFITDIKQAIGADAQAAGGLELEITENLIMEDVQHSIASLQAIRATGITIAIDDFGTGYSSLSYLAKLPVDSLKIDRSFVIDMTDGTEGLALVSTIINLAHSLKLKVVAEGVETEEQSRLLRLLDCDEMQGYLVSKPVPCDIFETRFLAPPPAAARRDL